MTVTVADRLSTAFTDLTLGALTLDPMINPGTLFRFDFTNTYSNPGAVGALAAGAKFLNLVDGGAQAAIVGSSAAFTNLAGKAGLISPGAGAANATYIDLGTYDLHASNHDFAVSVWLKTPAANFATGYPQIIVNGVFNNEAQDQFSLTTASDGKTPRGSVASGAALGYAAAAPSGAGLGVPTLASIVRIGTANSLWINGALVASAPVMPVNSLYDTSAQRVKIGSAYAGTLYVAALEDLTLSSAASGLSPLAQAQASLQAEYANNAGRLV